jgi:integrase
VTADAKTAAEAKAAKENALWPACVAWLKHKTPSWGESHASKVRMLLHRYVKNNETREGEEGFEVVSGLGARPIKEIKTPEITKLLKSIAVRQAITGKERREGAPHLAIILRQALDGVFRNAINDGRTETNPVAALRTSDVIQKPETRNNRKLKTPKELRGLFDALRDSTSEKRTILAIRLLLLTGLRTIEVREAKWPEIDFDKAVWTIPAERMKMKIEHAVPLAARMWIG